MYFNIFHQVLTVLVPYVQIFTKLQQFQQFLSYFVKEFFCLFGLWDIFVGGGGVFYKNIKLF